MLNFSQYKIMTFDCYGTLIDWESGILAVLKPLLTGYGIEIEDEQILQHYAEFESEQEQGEYTKYREILKAVVRYFGKRFDFEPSLAEQNALPDSIQNWQPFPDTVAALQRLQQRFKLAIISNVDEKLFADTAQHLEVEFDYIITAEQVKSYKPSLQNFKYALKQVEFPPEQLVHTAASRYHDIVPANSLGLATVWVNRTNKEIGAALSLPSAAAGDSSGGTLSTSAQPDLEVPDLQTLADLSLN